MFCPNCGKDCKDAKFCPECGTKLQLNSKPWPIAEEREMYDLPKRTNTRKGATSIPTSWGHRGSSGCVILNDDSVTVINYCNKKSIIPYDQLIAVVYLRPAYNGWRSGALLVRGIENQDVPIPVAKKLTTDISSVAFTLEQDTLFYHIFQLLKAVAPTNTKFEMILPEVKIKKLEEIAQGIDLNYFWDMYAPYRERAASGICAKHGVKPDAARALIDKLFDVNQRILYDTDALDAVRDLNLILGNKKREAESEKRLQEELRPHREKREIQETLDTIALIKLRQMHDE